MIIILGTDVNGGETVFNDGENMNDIGKIAHVLKHSHGRCIIGSLDKMLHEGSIWYVWMTCNVRSEERRYKSSIRTIDDL